MVQNSSYRGRGLYRVLYRNRISMIVFLLAILSSLSILYSQETSRVLVVVGGDGVVEVAITLYPSQSGEEIIYIDLPVKPIPGSIVVSPIDVVPQLLSNDTLALLKPAGVQRIDISYIASVNISGGVLSTLIRYPQWAGNLSVRIHKNIIPITMPDNIASVRSFGDYVIIDMARNTSWNLQYVIPPQQLATITTPPTMQQPMQQRQQGGMEILLPVSIGVAISSIAGVTLYLAIVRRKRVRASEEHLDNTDKEILSVIEKLGEASAKDIMNATKLPKTTLYRRLHKMIKIGIIGTKSRGGVTYYYIIKK